MIRLLTLLSAVTCTACAMAAGHKEAPKELMELRRSVSNLMAEGDAEGASSLLLSFDNSNIESSVFWEEITDCGFYPQETRLECVIEIRQPRGYGGPVGAFGSFEYVKFCVDWDNNGTFGTSPALGSTESVGDGIVHMHDESAGSAPPWHYAVYRDIDPPGGPRTTLGGASTSTEAQAITIRARAILSWTFEPTDCEYRPIWGSVHDFRIRLDPIR